MLRTIVILGVAGIAVGVGGGLVQGGTWFHGGELVFVMGLVALYVYAIWKDAAGVAKAEADMTSQAEGMPPSLTTQELPRQPVATHVRDVPSERSPSGRAGERGR